MEGGGGLDSSFRQPEKSQVTAARLISWVAEGGGGEGVRWDPLATMLITAEDLFDLFRWMRKSRGGGRGVASLRPSSERIKKKLPTYGYWLWSDCLIPAKYQNFNWL